MCQEKVNGAYIYQIYIQSRVTVSISCAGLYNSPFSFSHVKKCFSFRAAHLDVHTLHRDKLMIETSILRTPLVMYTSWYFHLIKKQETGPTQLRYSIIHQISHALSLRLWTLGYLEFTFKEAIPEKYFQLWVLLDGRLWYIANTETGFIVWSRLIIYQLDECWWIQTSFLISPLWTIIERVYPKMTYNE